MRDRIIISLFFFCWTVPNSFALEPQSCSLVRFADAGWTDIAATTGAASVVLEALGYRTDTKLLSVPVVFRSLKDKAIDVFLGDWMPSMASSIKPYNEDKSIEVVQKNLEGAKYTLAVNAAGAALGVRDFKDISAHKEAFGSKIYGIEPGNDGNRHILDMIDKDKFGLKGFHLIESSEQAMLAQLLRSEKDASPMVLLAWEPHPMNVNFNIRYLTGGDNIFGPNLGEATVYTVVRAGYLQECSNISVFLRNLKFSLAMENEIMNGIIGNKQDPKVVGRQWRRAHSRLLEKWLVGVTTFKGDNALETVRKSLQN